MHTLALTADLRVPVEAASAVVPGPLSAWLETGDDTELQRASTAAAAMPSADDDSGEASYAVEAVADPRELERQQAYIAFIACQNSGGGSAALSSVAGTRLLSLFDTCSPDNTSFLLALLVPLLLSCGRRSDARELLARATDPAGGAEEKSAPPSVERFGKGALLDSNWACCDALVSGLPTRPEELEALKRAANGATPVIRKRVLALLATVA
jgi:hypothetical protein